MAQEKMSRFVYIRLYTGNDYGGEYVCSGCGMKKPWNGEIYTKMRCENRSGRCNGVMKLQLTYKGGE